MIYPQDLERKLYSFKRPHQLTSLREGYWMSPGVHFLVDNTYTEWLLAKITNWMLEHPEIRNHKFQVFVLKVNPTTQKAVLEAQNDERVVLKSEMIDFTDFPLEWISIWVKDRVLMLPNEFAHSF